MIVVDTNILVYHWLPSPRSEETNGLMRLDPNWSAPLLWRSEFRNVLAGFLRRRQLDQEMSRTAIENAAGCLRGGEFPVADEVVLELIADSKCSSYDCEFVALARMAGTWLITEDAALLKAFPKDCRSLSHALRSGLSSE